MDINIDSRLSKVKSVYKDTLNFLQCTKIGEAEIPLTEPNINPNTEIVDIERAIQYTKKSGLSFCDVSTMLVTGITLVGLKTVCKGLVLIHRDEYGFVVKSGQVIFLKPGWHYIGYPLMSSVIRHAISSDFIKVKNLHIIRIRQDEIGIGFNSTSYEILLPGTHCRVDGAYIFKGRHKLNKDIVEGPIKLKTVRTGTVCICYNNGIAEILNEGRYIVNSNSYSVGSTLDITQQTLKFKQHKVLLDGGINMLVEGLLTYQIIDVAKMIKNVDVNVIGKYLEEMMQADLTKVFSTIHLEQISSTNYSEMRKDDDMVSETRLFIYKSIMDMIKPQADDWGIKIINFQLESTQLADREYSLDYEKASLQIAKSKAELKAQEAQNIILKNRAETQANINQIQAETEKKVSLIKAQALAEGLILEAEARANAIVKEGEAKAKAADLMKSEYGQTISMLQEKTKIAEGLKIHTLVMGGSSNNGGKSLVDNFVPVLNL